MFEKCYPMVYCSLSNSRGVVRPPRACHLAWMDGQLSKQSVNEESANGTADLLVGYVEKGAK